MENKIFLQQAPHLLHFPLITYFDEKSLFLIEKITDVYPANSLNTNNYRQTLINDCKYFINKDVPVRQLENDKLVDLTDKLVDEEGEEE